MAQKKNPHTDFAGVNTLAARKTTLMLTYSQ